MGPPIAASRLKDTQCARRVDLVGAQWIFNASGHGWNGCEVDDMRAARDRFVQLRLIEYGSFVKSYCKSPDIRQTT